VIMRYPRARDDAVVVDRIVRRAQSHPRITEAMMRYYQGRHPFYCGVDLHARKLYVSIVDEAGTLVEQRNLDAGPGPFAPTRRQHTEPDKVSSKS